MSFTVKLGYGSLNSKFSKCFVKLTDSSVKTLEDFQIKNIKTSLNIQFDGTQGLLRVPVKFSNGKDLIKSYSFNFAPEGKDGLTECFGCSNSTSPFKLLGSFSHKLVIKASDDVFQNTLEKMSMVEQESKKNCIKEIKFKDHERKLANFKSKHTPGTLEPKKVLVTPKPRKPEASVKPIQSANDSFDFTARKNTRVAPLMKRTALETSQYSSPPVSLPDVFSQAPITDAINESSIEEVNVVAKKPRIAHKSKEALEPTRINIEADVHEIGEEKDFESTYPPICSLEDEDSYRAEFERDYITYGELYARSNKRLTKFNRYVEDLKQETYRSDSYMDILTKIQSEHTLLMKNQQHVDEKIKYMDIHKKLLVIKRRIHDFDCPNDDSVNPGIESHWKK